MKNFPTFDEIRSQKTSFDGIQVQMVKTFAIVHVFQAFGVASPEPLYGFKSSCVFDIAGIPYD